MHSGLHASAVKRHSSAPELFSAVEVTWGGGGELNPEEAACLLPSRRGLGETPENAPTPNTQLQEPFGASGYLFGRGNPDMGNPDVACQFGGFPQRVAFFLLGCAVWRSREVVGVSLSISNWQSYRGL